MTLQEFADQVREENPFVDECYIAVIPNINNDGTETYHLEVEVEPESVLGGVYDTGVVAAEDDDLALDTARDLAEDLRERLEGLGLNVYEDRARWEASRDDGLDFELGGEG